MPLTYGNLTENLCKEKLSLAYVEAVAAVAGCVTAREYPDVGIDVLIRQEADFGVHTEAQLGIQAKSTANERWVDDALAFDLAVKNYAELRNPQVYVPRILVVMVVPEGRADWLTDAPELTELRKYAFWVSLKGAPETTNTSTQRVMVPRSQRFTVDALCGLLQRVGRREDL